MDSDVLHEQIVRSIIGIGFAGVLPVLLHIYEVETFEWKTILISLSLGGVVALFFGGLLQSILLFCGVHSILGLRIDLGYWQFPKWMFGGGY